MENPPPMCTALLWRTYQRLYICRMEYFLSARWHTCCHMRCYVLHLSVASAVYLSVAIVFLEGYIPSDRSESLRLSIGRIGELDRLRAVLNRRLDEGVGTLRLKKHGFSRVVGMELLQREYPGPVGVRLLLTGAAQDLHGLGTVLYAKDLVGTA